MVYANSQFAFPITSAVEEVLRAKGYRGAATICPLPLDPALYRPLDPLADRHLLPRAAGETVIGFVGRLVEPKGLRTLAAALEKLSALRWRLVLIGTGDFESGFRELLSAAHLAERATFLGYVPHEKTPAYLSAFEVLTEAMACGTAVVGSDSGEIPRLITASGGGLVFPEKDADALAAALRRLIEHPRQRQDLAAHGLNWTSRNVSLKAIATQMAGTLVRAVETNSHAPQAR
jgi:glycosyltransferase involved in cell wall biosynthesis